MPAESLNQEIHHSICVGGLFEQNHKYQTDSQGVCYIRQKVDRFKQLL